MKKHKWIGWEGDTSVCPVHENKMVVVMFSDGVIWEACRAGYWTWKHVDCDEGGDILAYRIAD